MLFGAAVAQAHSAKRHLVDPIDQLANLFLIRVDPKVVLRFGFVAQSHHQYVRMIWNAHTVAASRRFGMTDTTRHLLSCLQFIAEVRTRGQCVTTPDSPCGQIEHPIADSG